MILSGVWINIINWSYFQSILDRVEADLESLRLRTGYAFMFARDANTIIAHKYRARRSALEGSNGDSRDLHESLSDTAG